MDEIKKYVRNNSQTLFKSVESNNRIVFDNQGFLFSEEAQKVYNQIKDLPHVYVAWTENKEGFYYIGKSFQKGGRWKRQHAYHLGTLAYHLLDTTNNYDQNHLHWIDDWMQIKTLDLGKNKHFIQLYHEVKICFIPFEFYSKKDYRTLDKNEVRAINKKTEEDLIKSYIADNYKLLNVQHNNKTKTKKIIKSNIKIPPNKISLNSKNSLICGNNCFEFKVYRNQNIAIVANGIPNLPVGSCSIELFYDNGTDIRLYINGRIRNIRVLGRTVGSYFSAPDTANGNSSKWKIVQNEMNDPNNLIEKITVKVCPLIDLNK